MSGVLQPSPPSSPPIPAAQRAAVHGYSFSLVAFVAIFVAVGLDVTHHGVLAGIDHRIARWSALSVPDWGHIWARRATHLGDANVLAAIALFFAAWLVYRRRRLAAGVLVASAAATGILTYLLKDAFHRPRPIFTDPAGHVHSFSFPSGHASGAFAVYVLAALLLTAGLSARWRIAAVSAAIGLATLVAATRVVMPVHYLTDVIAGAAVGLAAVAVGLLVQAAAGRGR